MRRRAWKWLLGIVVAMILVLGAVVGDAHRRAGVVLERHRKELAERSEAFAARGRVRTPAFEDPLDGNAWTHYSAALAAIAAIPQELADAVPEIEGTINIEEDPPDEHLLENLFAEQAPIFEAFRRGARSRTLDLGIKITGEPGQLFPYISDSIKSAKFVMGASNHAHRLGRDAEALAHARLGLAFAQDIEAGRLLIYSLVGIVCEGIATYSMRELLAEHSLSARDLARFAGQLDALDAGRPDMMECWASEDLYVRSAFVNGDWKGFEGPVWVGLGGGKPNPVYPGWRCLFSRRIARAQALTIHTRLFEEIQQVAPLKPWEREARSEEIFRGAETTKNPLTALFCPAFGRAFKREALAQLQRVLLRVSVAVAWYESEKRRYPRRMEDLVPRYLPKVPLCPFTGIPILTQDGRVWSVGINKVDDGGTQEITEPEDGGKADIVWTVKRK